MPHTLYLHINRKDFTFDVQTAKYQKRFMDILYTNIVSMGSFVREALSMQLLRESGGSVLLVGSIMGYMNQPELVIFPDIFEYLIFASNPSL